MVCGITMLYLKTMVYGFAINSLKINLVLQLAHNDIGLAPCIWK